MGKTYEVPDIDIKYDEVKSEVAELYGSLVCLYMELQNKYKDLFKVLKEIKEYKDDIDRYVPAMHKLSYLSIQIPNLVDQEHRLLTKESFLLPFLEERIKREHGIKKDVDLKNFSFFDAYINKDYETIKNNFIIMRMIRAVKYYSDYQDQYFMLASQFAITPDKDSIRDCIMYDTPDKEAINTLYIIGRAFKEEESDEEEAKYKCLLSFVNPNLERWFINYDFDKNHPFLFEDEEQNPEETKRIKNQIIKGIIAIQNNKVINSNEHSEKVLNDKLTMSQMLNILFHYNDYTSKYENRFEQLINEYHDNYEEVAMIFAYLQQLYINMSHQAIEDLDHLFSVMTKKENKMSIGSTVILQKIVDHFYNKSEIISQREETQNMRKRTKDDDYEDDDE